MWEALFVVITNSLSGVMAPGPMFTVTLAKSMKSPWAGVFISLGHAVVEVPLILVIYFGLRNFFQNDIFRLVLSMAGGGMIVWMGYDLFRIRKRIIRDGKDTSYNAFVAGILMSGLNPFFLFWWATAGLKLILVFNDAVGTWGMPFFILVHWLCDFVWLSVISFTIFKTHSFWGEKIQELVFILLSALLVYFGSVFVVQGLDSYLGSSSWDWIKWILWALGFMYMLYWMDYYFDIKKKIRVRIRRVCHRNNTF
jgi:threonine/homoserine/homoserine lactone efflux protein